MILLGFIIGFIGQPAWLYTSYTNEQWGIFALSFVYIFSYVNGIKNWISIKNENKRLDTD